MPPAKNVLIPGESSRVFDHAGNDQGRDASLPVVRGQETEILELESVVEGIARRRGPRATDTVEVDGRMRNLMCRQEVTECIHRGRLAHPDLSVHEDDNTTQSHTRILEARPAGYGRFSNSGRRTEDTVHGNTL